MKILLLFLSLFHQTIPALIPTVAPTPSSDRLLPPIAQFKERITKKPFGVYITPKSSPVQPEKFTGYHTGTDVEYQDITADVPVFAITSGIVIFSGHVNGYGGVIIIRHQFQNKDLLALYGHLKPSSLIPKDSVVKAGDTIAILGKGFSSETDGERKHLHFAILKSDKIDFRGYVQKQPELAGWIDPLTLYN